MPDESPLPPREALAGKDARTPARDILGMSQPEFSAAFKGSPMKRAKLRGLKRNAAVVVSNVGIAEDVPTLRRALDDSEPLVRELAPWGLERIARKPVLDDGSPGVHFPPDGSGEQRRVTDSGSAPSHPSRHE